MQNLKLHSFMLLLPCTYLMYNCGQCRLKKIDFNSVQEMPFQHKEYNGINLIFELTKTMQVVFMFLF